MLVRNKDLNREILLNLDDKSLAQYCQTSKMANQICQDESFWINKVLRRFGHILGDIERIKQFKRNKEKKKEGGINTWRNYYISLINNIENRYDDPDNSLSKYEDDLLIVEQINKNTNDLINLYENNYVFDEIFSSSTLQEEKNVKDVSKLWKSDLLDVNEAFFNISRIYDDIEEHKTQYLSPILNILLDDDRFKPDRLIVALDFVSSNEGELKGGFETVLGSNDNLPSRYNTPYMRNKIFRYILFNDSYESVEKLNIRTNQLKNLMKYFNMENNKELFNLVIDVMADYKCAIKQRYLNVIITRMKEIGITRKDFADYFSKITSLSPQHNFNLIPETKRRDISAIKCLIKHF